jgi:hypothetical protein
MHRLGLFLLPFLGLLISFAPSGAAEADPVRAASAYRKAGQPVEPISDNTIVAEAEEFQPAGPGWKAQPWGANYFCATLANTFLSRKGFLGAPEQCDPSAASIEVRVPKAGRYLALVRYEAAYRFQTQFTLRVEQNGAKLLERLYGARDNMKIWAFSQKLKSELAWDWGAVENLVWEGHDAAVQLQAGKARLTLSAGRQPEPAARRNVDLVLLTSDEAQVKNRIDKESYLPLDGLLTQAGDVYLKVQNAAGSPALTLTVGPSTEHSPYWVHLRDWKPRTLAVKPGETTDWVEVGSLLDSLNDGQWNLTAKGQGALNFHLEFGVRSADGKVESIRRFDNLKGNVSLAYDANTRYTCRIRLAEEVLYELLETLKKHPVRGTPPKRTLVLGYTFSHQDGNAKYNAAVDEFVRLTGATALVVGPRSEVPVDAGLRRGSIGVRGVPTDKLEAECKKLQAEGKADRIAVVSLGDEIGLAAPAANDHAGFRAWLQGQKRKPADLDPSFTSWEQVKYSPAKETARTNPALFYYSRVYGCRHGIKNLKERTDILRRYLPHAGVGANFSPHAGHVYLGTTHQWVSLFREGGMTMPWSEDYIWQVPLGTQQMNTLAVDLLRAGIRQQPDARLHYYVMPHAPGNTPNSWRRQFYGTLAHGARVFNLFEFRPVQAAYTENHVSGPAMYQEVRRALHELGTFEDLVQDGRVRPGLAGLWFSEAADVWDDNDGPFGPAKRTLYIAARHQQLPLDVVVEGDDLKPYRVLYLTDRHVSRAASQALAEWVKGGGQLLATAGAGMWDEFGRPNQTLRELFGVVADNLAPPAEPLRLEKQDLPFARPAKQVVWKGKDGGTLPAFGVVSNCVASGAETLATFGGDDRSPAVTRKKAGKGFVLYCAFQPGLSYFHPALPRRPVDRATTDDSMAHFIPTDFDRQAARLFEVAAEGVGRPVRCSEPLVDSTVIEAKQGVLIPLINWSKGPVKGLTVTVALDVPAGKVSLAGGGKVEVTRKDGRRVFTLDLDVADALILRP